MSDAAHWLIPFASCAGEGCSQARAALALPHLDRLLARLDAGAPLPGEMTDLSMPHEKVLARECGFAAADGRIPLAAWHAKQSGTDPGTHAWAWITPCHWIVHRDHIAMGNPRQLALEEDESRTFLAAMRTYFEQDGITLVREVAATPEAPARWLARGEVFRELATASLDRVVGGHIDDWLPRGPEARSIRRLQQEMQMLLYTHEANDARAMRGLQPVNSFWVSGTGALPPGARSLPANFHMTFALRDAALAGDWTAWAAVWEQFGAREVAQLLHRLDEGVGVAITLCGERHARTWRGQGTGLLRKVRSAFGRGRAAAALETL